MANPIFAGVASADYHLDRFNRLDDFARCVDFVIAKAVEKKRALDAVCGNVPIPFYFQFVGDGYKTWHPAPIEMAIFHRLNCLSDHGIRGSVVVGNHDWPESEDYRGAHCFTEIKTLGFALRVIDEATVEPITVHNLLVGHNIYIPHVPKAKLQRSGLGYREYFRKQLSDLLAQCPADSRIMVFSHVYLKEAAVGPSDLVIEGDRQVSIEDLKDPRIMAVICGDIHKAQKLCDRPLILYPGSIDRVDFGEANEAKGFVYYEVYESGEVRIEFVQTPARAFHHIVIDLVGGSAQADKAFEGAPQEPSALQPWLEERLKNCQTILTGAIVKLTIRCGPNQKALVDDRKLTALIEQAGADRVRSVNYEVTTPDQRRAPEITEGLSPVAALEKWVGGQGYQPLTAQTIIIAGKKLIGVQG